MNYSGIASSINNNINTLNTSITNIESIDFETIWNGRASTSLLNKLDNLMTKTKTEENNLSRYANILNEMQIYVEKKNKLKELKASLSRIPSDKKYDGERAALASSISLLQIEIENIKNQINGALSGFKTISSEININGFNGSTIIGDFNYIMEPGTITAKQSKLGRKNIYHGATLYDVYDVATYHNPDDKRILTSISKDNIIDQSLKYVTDNYSGREAVVNSSIVLLNLAAEKGLILPYRSDGVNYTGEKGVCALGVRPQNLDDQILQGPDCSALVSWAVNKGSIEPFNWRQSTSFKYIGEQIPYNDIQPADVFAKDGHVALAIANDPVSQTVIIHEAKGQNVGVVERTVTYDELKAGGFIGIDMSEYYEKSINTTN